MRHQPRRKIVPCVFIRLASRRYPKACSEDTGATELRLCNAASPKTAIVGAIGCGGAALSAFAARAQDSAPPPTAASQDEPYQPSLGDIMALQQDAPHQAVVCGRAGNWPLADYEIGELSEGFDDVSKMLGGDIVEQHVGAPLDALQKAVDDKNSAAFAAAFDSLSAGCNACHHTLDHAFIVIARPTVLPYSDQVIRAAEIIETLNRSAL